MPDNTHDLRWVLICGLVTQVLGGGIYAYFVSLDEASGVWLGLLVGGVGSMLTLVALIGYGVFLGMRSHMNEERGIEDALAAKQSSE